MKKVTKTVDGVQYRRIPTFKEKVHNDMMKELFTGVEEHSNGVDIEVYEESKSQSVITMTLKEDALKKYKKKEMKIEGKDLFELHIMFIWYGNHFKFVLYYKESGLPKLSSGYSSIEKAKEAKRKYDQNDE